MNRFKNRATGIRQCLDVVIYIFDLWRCSTALRAMGLPLARLAGCAWRGMAIRCRDEMKEKG